MATFTTLKDTNQLLRPLNNGNPVVFGSLGAGAAPQA